MRSIADILFFRGDLSPFLVHLTRATPTNSASETLKSILTCRFLIPGDDSISDARFAMPFVNYTEERRDLLSAVSFTETPLNEVHSLLEIASRQVNLEPYGLVFIKSRLKGRGVSPVIYINNESGDKSEVVQALASLRESHPAAARQLLPLIAVFGKKLQPVGAGIAVYGQVDFSWEREWRFPEALGMFEFSVEDIFVGLCPHAEIQFFEDILPPIGFIDPTRNVKWYATKLVEARQRVNMKHSVV